MRSVKAVAVGFCPCVFNHIMVLMGIKCFTCESQKNSAYSNAQIKIGGSKEHYSNHTTLLFNISSQWNYFSFRTNNRFLTRKGDASD